MKPTEPHPSAKNRTSDVPKAASLIQWIQITRTSKPHLRKPWGSSEGMFLWSYPIYYFLSRVYDSWTGLDLFGKRIFRSSKYFSSPPDKKKSHKRNVHVWNQVHFFRLRSHEKLKFPSEKKNREKEKKFGGEYYFFIIIFLWISFYSLSPEKNIKMLCVKVIEEKKKNHKIIIKTHFPHEWNWKKFQEKKNCFFCLEKKSGQ